MDREDSPPRALLRRRRVLLLLGSGATAVAATGLGAGRLVRSPQQLLAETAPPPRTVLTAAVERRVLSDTVVLRGVVGAQQSVEVTPTAAEAARPVVTAVRVKAGQRIGSGTVLAEVSGRPLIALPGGVPAYRDLRPGMRGGDVAQAQAALRALGHDPREPAGTYGAGTKRAVEALYQRLGYASATTGEAGMRQVTDAAEQVRQRERALAQARDTLERLRRAGPAPAGTPSPSPSPSASRSPAAADPGQGGTGQGDPLADAERQVRFATEDLAAARTALADLERTVGATLPMAEVVFVAAFPARVEKLDATVGGPVKTPMLTMSSGPLVIRGRLNPADRALVKPALAVEVTAELLGLTVAGTVASVGELEKDEGGNRYYPIVVTPVGAPFAERLNGTDVRLSVVAASTAGPVLVVPVTAVYADADGRTGVLRVRPGRPSERVVVTAGPSGDGYVAIVADQGGLEAGDTVAIGTAP